MGFAGIEALAETICGNEILNPITLRLLMGRDEVASYLISALEARL